MVRHIVIWDFEPGSDEAENLAKAATLKTELEALKGRIDGLVDIRVESRLLPASNAKVILNSLFENQQALDAYQIHPEHQRVGVLGATFLRNRKCVDYME